MSSDTHYRLERSGTAVDVDGFKLGEHTGHVICEACSRAAPTIEGIVHEDGCDNVKETEQLEASE